MKVKLKLSTYVAYQVTEITDEECERLSAKYAKYQGKFMLMANNSIAYIELPNKMYEITEDSYIVEVAENLLFFHDALFDIYFTEVE